MQRFLVVFRSTVLVLYRQPLLGAVPSGSEPTLRVTRRLPAEQLRDHRSCLVRLSLLCRPHRASLWDGMEGSQLVSVTEVADLASNQLS